MPATSVLRFSVSPVTLSKISCAAVVPMCVCHSTNFLDNQLFQSFFSSNVFFSLFLISFFPSSWRPSSTPVFASPLHSPLFLGNLSSSDPSIPLLAYSLLFLTCPSSPPAPLVPPTPSSTACSLVRKKCFLSGLFVCQLLFMS